MNSPIICSHPNKQSMAANFKPNSYDYNKIKSVTGSLTKNEIKACLPLDSIPSQSYDSWKELSNAIFHLPKEIKDTIRTMSSAKKDRKNINTCQKRKQRVEAMRSQRQAHRMEGQSLDIFGSVCYVKLVNRVG
jgi:hypothetical protein